MAGNVSDLRQLFFPRSVAVIGASRIPGKWGYLMSKSLLSGYRGEVYLVNNKGGELFGRQVYRSLSEVDGPVDLAVIGIPARFVESAVDECVARGVKGVIVVTAGFQEIGEAGKEVEQRIVQKVVGRGGRVIGPNCLGFYNSAIDLNTTLLGFDLKGPLTFLTQSGNIGVEIDYLATRRGIGFSCFVSYGNQADVQLYELLDFVKDDPNTRVVLLYVEGVKDGRQFLRAVREISATRPVVAYKVGVTEAGTRSASSHTGSIVGHDQVFDATFKQAGGIRAVRYSELLDIAEAFIQCPLPLGNRVAILADGGGHGTICADVSLGGGLQAPVLSPRLQQELKPFLPPHASTRNPVDFAGAGEEDLWNFARASEALLRSGEVDGLLIVGSFGGYRELFEGELADLEDRVALAISELVGRYHKPIVVHSLYAPSHTPALEILSSHHVPVYAHIETATTCMGALAGYSRHLAKAAKKGERGQGVGTHGHAPRPGGVWSGPNTQSTSCDLRGPSSAGSGTSGRGNPTEDEAYEILRRYGCPVPEFRLTRSKIEAMDAAGEIGHPVVL